MKDEVLQKALESDTSVIPRYDIVLPNGTKVAENVQLVLKNTILTAGTLLNKQSLLKDVTAILYDLPMESAVPDDIFLTLRGLPSYCPKLKILSVPGATISVQRLATGEEVKTYSVAASTGVTIDLMQYGTYKVWATISNVPTEPKYVDIYETKQYTVELYSYVTYAKFTVTQEVGATVTATSTEGSIASGVVGADKTCTIALYKQSTWSCVCTYDGVAAQTISITTTASTGGTTIEKTPVWTKVVVQTTSGATVRIYKSSSISKTAVSTNGSCTFWMPDTDTWSISASYNGKNGSGFVAPTLYGTKTVTISLS